MSLFKECRYCHQLFSKAGLEQHLKTAHYNQLTVQQKARALSGPAKKPLPVPGAATSKPNLPREPNKQASKIKPEFLAMPRAALAPMDVRVLKAKAAQRERSFKQAQRNRAISETLTQSVIAQQRSQPATTPLRSKWQEEVAKLAEARIVIKGDSYALQLQSVPPSTIPPPVDRTKRRARKPLAHAKNKKTTESWPCSCGGENERCFRCFGTGLEEISAKEALKRQRQTLVKVTPGGPASFAKDGIREAGRFSSSPSQDDFGDESFS